MCLLREEDDIGSEVSIFQISALLKLRKIIPSANVQLGCGEKKRNGYFFFTLRLQISPLILLTQWESGRYTEAGWMCKCKPVLK